MRMLPRAAADPTLIRREAAKEADLQAEEINDLRVVRKSIDARQRKVMVNLAVKIASGEDKLVAPEVKIPEYKRATPESPVVVIVGAGPAGLFAGLRALELGMRPIIIERGKDVDSRRKDLARIAREDKIDPESNYSFGEGGAGAFSDGKLFTRSKKRGNVEEILQTLCFHGADESVLIDAHPHIGTDRLPQIIKNIRQTIMEYGGEVRFETRVTGLKINDGKVCGVILADGSVVNGPVVLATGHSARDVYRMLNNQGIELEQKGLAMGVRLEHPQSLIDSLRYHIDNKRGEFLPPAEYSFVTQVDGRGVYSFCMCPGGVIVPSATGENQSVVNGMSGSGRAGRWSNSGMVVEIRPEDFPDYSMRGPLGMMELQEDLERKFYECSGNTLNAPAQRMTDFVAGRKSTSLNPTSFAPGIHSERVDALLPQHISSRLKSGFKAFDKKNKGFLTDNATVIGLESRTSSPVRIPRDPATLSHPSFAGLYPAGEGAGFAGGIVSAAIDGKRCMDAIAGIYKMSNESK